eukprot:1713589-Pleurochrysis_carterae.AAC.1
MSKGETGIRNADTLKRDTGIMYLEGYVQRNTSHCKTTHTLIYLYPNRIGLPMTIYHTRLTGRDIA